MEYEIKLSSVYIFVKDMKRAVKFYEQIFNQKVAENGTEFYINGIRKFWLFDYKAVNDNRAVFGHNCLPSFEVSDIKAFMKKLDNLQVPLVFPLTKIGNNWVLEFKDPEGNDIEIFSKYHPLEEEPEKDYRFY
jgi:predicted enzyme related to lactoylglutathione lyase